MNHKDLTYFVNGAGLSRRAAARIALGGGASALLLGRARAANVAMRTLAPELKITINWGANPTPDDLKFLNEVGYQYVRVGVDRVMPVEEMLAIKKKYADAGITVDCLRYRMADANGDHLTNMLLDLPGREAAISTTNEWIRTAAKAGVTYCGANLMASGVWSSGETAIRGGVTMRRFDPASPEARGGGVRPRPAGGIGTLYHGRTYSYDEMMGNFKKYFVRDVVPVLEETGSFMGFHPDDPPLIESMGGVARLLNNYDRYQAMFAATGDSPHVGLMMCCGTYIEGGDRMGPPVTTMLRELWARRKFYEIHYRNVSNPAVNGVPDFTESFLDDGYYDMYKIMKVLVDVGYTGYLHFDHDADVVGAPYAYAAYCMGFMKAALQRAMAEPKAKF